MQTATDERISAKATGLVPLDTLAATIKASIIAGDKALDKAEQHYKAAGIHLAEAKKRLPIEQPGKRFTAYIVGECRMATSRAYELIAIAEGRTTLEEIRAKGRERASKFSQKNKVARDSVSNGKRESQFSGPTEEDCEDCNSDSERWERSLSNMAGDAISIRAFWNKTFGKEWENFEVPSTAVTLAKQAAKEWTELAADLTKRKARSADDGVDREHANEAFATRHFMFTLDGVLDAASEAIECIENVSLSKESANNLEKSSDEIITAWIRVKSAINQRRTMTSNEQT
jgi:hypothetical protein